MKSNKYQKKDFKTPLLHQKNVDIWDWIATKIKKNTKIQANKPHFLKNTFQLPHVSKAVKIKDKK